MQNVWVVIIGRGGREIKNDKVVCCSVIRLSHIIIKKNSP